MKSGGRIKEPGMVSVKKTGKAGARRSSAAGPPDKAPLVSIITVSYQAADTIGRTIDSVLALKNVRYEYIVIDGGSTDGTLGIIERHRKDIDFWVSEPDEGIYHAMNKGVAAARGEWLIFLNAGDAFRPGMLAVLLGSAQSASAETGVVSGHHNLVDSGGRSIGLTLPGHSARARLQPPEDRVAHQAALTRRSVFGRYGGFNQGYPIRGDYDYWVRVSKAGAVFLFTDHIVTDFLSGGVSSQRSRYLSFHKEQLLIGVKYGRLSLASAAVRFACAGAFHATKTFLFRMLGTELGDRISLSRAKKKWGGPRVE